MKTYDEWQCFPGWYAWIKHIQKESFDEGLKEGVRLACDEGLSKDFILNCMVIEPKPKNYGTGFTTEHEPYT